MKKNRLLPLAITGLLRVFTFSCCAVLLLFAFGCEEPGTDSPAKPDQRAATDGSPSEALFTIRYRPKWLHQAQFAGVYMAKEKGLYKQRGLNVVVQPGGLDFPSYDALIAGETDVTDQFLIYALAQSDLGQNLVNLAQVSQKNSTRLVGRKSSGITKLEDLRGKKVGIWRNESGELVRLLLDKMKLDVDIVTIDWSVNLLLNNAIDMMNVMTYNEYHRLLMAGLDSEDLVTLNLTDYGYGLVEEGLYTTLDYYQNHTQECQAFAEATMEGWIYAFAHREETLDVVLRYLRESYLPANRSHQAWMLDHMRENVLEDPNAVGFLRPDDFDTALDVLMENGWVKTPVDYRKFYPHAIKKKS